ncbi:ATP-binding protein [Oceanimonas smirnovii]|uniref:ATP-binding protein n=1 Tax=Oceanimonas smirnovii TaxID=264574 RepID=A0ABW7P5L7_9GAMM
MIDVAALWQKLLAQGEDARLEAKAATGGVGDSIMQTVCAFANEPGLGGGYLLLGVAEPDESNMAYRPLGLDDVDNLLNTLQVNCRDQFETPVFIRAEAATVEGKVLLAIAVDEVDDGLKPVRFKGTTGKKNKRKTGVWRRGINGDYECNEVELEPLLRAKSNQTYDQALLRGAEWEDLDPDTIAHYRQLRQRIKPDAEELQGSDEDMLRALNLVEKKHGHYVPNLAGLLLFAKPQALRRLLPAHRVDYIRVPGTQWVEDPDQRFTTLDLRAPLLRLIPRAEATILDDLPRQFRLPEGQLQRQDIPLLPQRVVREVVVNALMHRDYHIHQPVQIIRYSNRIEVRNPGFSLKPEEQLGEPGSRQRNPVLAAVLYDLNLAETKGSGIRVMRRLLREAGLSAPLFVSDRQQEDFVATYLFHHFLSDDDLAWLEPFQSLGLCDEQRLALLLVREQGAIDNAAYRDINGVDTLTASQQLTRLCQLNLLEKGGQGSGTYYQPGPGFPPVNGTTLPEALAEVTNTAQLAHNVDQQSSNVDQLPAYPDQFGADPAQLQAYLPADLLQSLPIDGRKPRQAEIRLLLLRLCQCRAFSAEQLATLLGGRKKNHLISSYLTPMIQEQLLELTHPDVKNHPHQAYRLSAAGAQVLKEGKI